MAPVPFSINFDYRCPFARLANEHVLAAVAGGAPYQVSYVGFSLNEAHVEEGQPSAFDGPPMNPEHVALAAGIAVRDNHPEHFAAVHLSLFTARHVDGNDLRDFAVVRSALERGGVDPDLVFAELEEGTPFATLRSEHERSVKEHQVFGVPTFILNDQAAFVRLMTQPRDARHAQATVDNVLRLLSDHVELNEFKHTSLDH